MAGRILRCYYKQVTAVVWQNFFHFFFHFFLVYLYDQGLCIYSRMLPCSGLRNTLESYVVDHYQMSEASRSVVLFVSSASLSS